jgi:hypothetical protein
MTLQSLGGKFEACARELLKLAAGEEAPATFPTVMEENMIKHIVEPQSNMPAEFAYRALSAALSLAHDKAKDLSRDQIETVIRKHFEFE